MSVQPQAPSITISPNVANQGDRVLLLALGFSKGEKVKYTWPKIGYEQELTADSKGVINAIITIDKNRAPDRYEVVLVGKTSGLDLGAILTVRSATPAPTTPTGPAIPPNETPVGLYKFMITAIDGAKAGFVLTAADYLQVIATKDPRVHIGDIITNPVGPPNSLTQVQTWLNQHGLSTAPPVTPGSGPTTPPSSATPSGPIAGPTTVNIGGVQIPGLADLFKNIYDNTYKALTDGIQKGLLLTEDQLVEQGLARLRVQKRIAEKAKDEGLI